MGKALIEGNDPLADAGLASVDFLSATNQTDYDAPIRMSIDAGQQELRL